MLYHIYTHIAIFFHISYNSVSTQAHSINQNNFLGKGPLSPCNPCQGVSPLDSHHTINDNDMLFYSLTTTMFFLTRMIWFSGLYC